MNLARSLTVAWLVAGASWACGGNEHVGPSGAETGGFAGTSAETGGSSAAGRASNGGDTVEGGASSGGSAGAGTSGTGAGSGAGGSEVGFWCDLSDTDVCKCRSGPKPNAAATTSCPESDCCVRTGAGDNRSCACSKPDSLFTCEDVRNYVSGAIEVAACPFTESCPATPPVNGTPCTPPYAAADGFATCSYGSDPRPQCRMKAVCQTGAWQISTPACTAPPLPETCPTTAPSQSSACSDTALSCWYGDGTRCWCSACARGSPYPNCQAIDPPQLFCAPLADGCPKVMPQAGAPCSTPGASCGPDCMLTITCTDGVWQWAVGMCPVCASPETPIATPDGERPIASLHAGDLVYSVERDAIVAVPLVKVEHTAVARHRVVRVVLEDGRVLEISPGHPTADGRTFGDLLAGSRLDAEHSVLSAELVPYGYAATYDILPASSTGTYYAAGALIGSTLLPR